MTNPLFAVDSINFHKLGHRKIGQPVSIIADPEAAEVRGTLYLTDGSEVLMNVKLTLEEQQGIEAIVSRASKRAVENLEQAITQLP